jgi:hypothetical protein
MEHVANMEEEISASELFIFDYYKNTKGMPQLKR